MRVRPLRLQQSGVAKHGDIARDQERREEAAEEHELDEGDAPCRSQLHERRQDRKAHGARQAEHDAPPDVFLWMRHFAGAGGSIVSRSEEHTSELQSLMRNSYAVFCLKK